MVKSQKSRSTDVKLEERKLTTTVSLSEVMRASFRLEASAYNPEAREAVARVKSFSNGYQPILGEDGLANECSIPNRLKRIYVEEAHGIPFLSSSDIIDLKPEPENFVSRKLTKRSSGMLIKEGDILISRSGTIGNIGFAGRRIAGMALSEHALRLRANEHLTAGFIAAFLRSKYGRLQLTCATYGSVISHIEPHHVGAAVIPRFHPVLRSKIGLLFKEACEARDEANDLLDDADRRLQAILKLPNLSSLAGNRKRSLSTTVKASHLGGRLDGSFHDALAEALVTNLSSLPMGVLRLDDPALTKKVGAVTKFRKRIYVKDGIPLLSSKQLFQNDPIDVKKLSKKRHSRDMNEIALVENMIAITCSGTIGKVQIIPKYMEGWAANQHANRVLAVNAETAGFLYTWLSSEFGYKLITRHSYGSVILEMDRFMLASVPVPNIPMEQRHEIGTMVLNANAFRDVAWQKEQKAIQEIEEAIEANEGH